LSLRSPPIIEAWIGFRFSPNAAKQPWDLPVALPFINHFGQTLDHVQVVRTEEITIQERTAQGIPKSISGKQTLDRVQARNPSGTRWLQVADDMLVYNIVEKGSAYPGYDMLCEAALGALTSYVDFFSPSAVKQVAIHYVDLIELPNFSQGINVPEFFNVFVKVPDGFSDIERFSTNLIFAPSSDDHRLSIRFRSEPINPVNKAIRFRMEWHADCDNIDSLESTVVRSRLDLAHEDIRKHFQLCFTDRTWKLFEPRPR